MKKILIMICLFVWPIAAAAQDVIIIKPVLPGTDIEDFSKPSLIINPDGSSYCTRPGTRIRDFSKGGYFDNRTFQHQYRINNPVQQQMRRLFPEKNGKTAPYNQ